MRAMGGCQDARLFRKPTPANAKKATPITAPARTSGLRRAPLALALLASGLPAWTGRTPWRRAFMLAGFPLSLVASGAAGALPAWAWLLPLAHSVH